MSGNEVTALLRKYKENTATEEEVALLLSLVQNWGQEEDVTISEEVYASIQQELSENLFPEEEQIFKVPEESRPLIYSLWPRIAVAVCLVLGVFIGFKFYQPGFKTSENNHLVKNDVPAGGNKAYLTLSNGKRIALTDVPDGKLADQEGVQVSKAANGQLVYTLSADGIAEGKTAGQGAEGTIRQSINKIETPKGGQYQVNLPDGSRVWLNAASSLKFPTAFTGQKERVVELSGEAYFEVNHKASQPFIVRTSKQDVIVLGTHFNVNSYADETYTKTTLLQGSVLVKRNVKISDPKPGKDLILLKPGQQAILNTAIQVADADVEMAVAWKDGNFMFNDVNLLNILRQLSRWYDVSVDYNHVPKNRVFTGFISRDVNLSKVLKMLEVTGGIKFTVEDKTIKITDLNP